MPDGTVAATVRILDATGAAVASASGVSLAQSGDSFTIKEGPVTDHLFAAWRPGLTVEVLISGTAPRYRQSRWTCDAPKITDELVTLDGKKVSP